MLNFFTDEIRRDPFPVYDQLRSSTPLLHDPQSGLWIVFDYDGVKRALGDQEAFASSLSTVANHPTPPWLV